MVAELVVRHALSEIMISSGADLTGMLDEAHLDITASLWLYVPESGSWRFVIGSPQTETRGPRWVYKKIQTVLSKMPEGRPKVSLKDISVVDSSDPLISHLKVTVRTGMSIPGIRLSDNVINGITIDEAYVYRVS
ncbi:MAG TPA: hypothetical protein VGN86_00880 [Pyrinomonadaceae bacterium]|nr:hypothetical protein [Pyrinomonadaceae bacterium]